MHVPVLQKEVIEYLDPKPNENFIDCTLGEGGHSAAILERNKPRGKVLGIEIDPELHQKLKARMEEIPSPNDPRRSPTGRTLRGRQFPNRLILVNNSFVNLEKIVEKHKFGPVSGILFDLGLSSWHLEESKRGFSFLKPEPLDMRYNPETTTLTADTIVNFWPQIEIEKILREYGEERYAKRISVKIVEARKIKPIQTTFQLLEIIKTVIPGRQPLKKTSFAARTFQAIRITVNNELKNLENVLPKTLEILGPKGRLTIISFHSLEDRIVKNFIRKKAKEGSLKILTKKPVTPSIEEIKINPRSRSAKLRAAQKV